MRICAVLILFNIPIIVKKKRVNTIRKLTDSAKRESKENANKSNEIIF